MTMPKNTLIVGIEEAHLKSHQASAPSSILRSMRSSIPAGGGHALRRQMTRLLKVHERPLASNSDKRREPCDDREPHPSSCL
jgi:hypothetical protein